MAATAAAASQVVSIVHRVPAEDSDPACHPPGPELPRIPAPAVARTARLTPLCRGGHPGAAPRGAPGCSEPRLLSPVRRRFTRAPRAGAWPPRPGRHPRHPSTRRAPHPQPQPRLRRHAPRRRRLTSGPPRGRCHHRRAPRRRWWPRLAHAPCRALAPAPLQPTLQSLRSLNLHPPPLTSPPPRPCAPHRHPALPFPHPTLHLHATPAPLNSPPSRAPPASYTATVHLHLISPTPALGPPTAHWGRGAWTKVSHHPHPRAGCRWGSWEPRAAA
ncbi:PREDICTED: splicing factor 3A subunit 2-like [Dipodomys ordii]|uniref:Splicing factor 3A subunit 2-like n=1 Tax=Dipodomys ordii TaxID=10020 RepID=A0A1S3EVP2_DIPOR|nr:PREDICTED: splicing factor 3A subunit 2-like [Dipodomys ordii]